MEHEAQSQKQSWGRRNFELLGLCMLFAFITIVAYSLYEIVVPKKVSYKLRACSLDAMQCPDGLYIGRSGPACTFDCTTKTGTVKPSSDDYLLLQRTASWGPCALPDPSSCHDELTLSQGGSLKVSSVKGSVDEILSDSTLEKIKTYIRTSNLLYKPCDAAMIVDYTVHYRITLDGTTRDIDFPGCTEDMKIIDAILNS